MRAMSNQAKETMKTRKRLRWSLMAHRGNACEACPHTPVGATPPRPFDDMHEVLTRGRGGDPLDCANILLVCRDCHKWITEHETEARAAGLVRARTAAEHAGTFHPWLNGTPVPELEL